MIFMVNRKPLGGKAYGSIPHLIGSRKGPKDCGLHVGQHKICTEKTRDKHDTIIVTEKLDGSNCSVFLKENVLYPLTRAGYIANTSPFRQHHHFHDYVLRNEQRFRSVLNEGERIVGEWCVQAHGTLYNFTNVEPFFVFDIFTSDNKRLLYSNFLIQIGERFNRPAILSIGCPKPIEEMLVTCEYMKYPCKKQEGVVYRVERKERVDFLAKYVRPDKEDGKYLNKGQEVWNVGVENYLTLSQIKEV